VTPPPLEQAAEGNEADQAAIVPQHLVLVLPSTGEFDSRSYRIARALLDRGHRVTMLARWKAGLALEEQDPAGYPIIRVPASTMDGLPFKGLRSLAGGLVRRLYLLRTRDRGRPSGGTAPASASASGEAANAAASPAPTAARASLPRRAWLAAIQKLAIPLTIRSHVRNARRVAPRADLYHGMAYMGIPIALDLGRRNDAAVVYDARDIYLEARNLARSSGLTRWLAASAERGWAARSGRVITVNDAYADVMAERLRVTRPLVVMNCSYRYNPAEPRERRFHERFGLAPSERIVLYHGGLFPHRGVEELMDAATMVDGTTLVLMGYGVLEPEFRVRAGRPPYAGRIQMMNAVPPAELLDWVACADVVGMPIQASTLNHRLTTPNKLFEAMAAGVPSVVSDLPGMAAIVRESGCGTLVDPANVDEIAAAIREIVGLSEADWQAWRRRCLDAAHDRYNWETQVGRLLDEYSRLTGKRW
jgi:glycosyltransferase involved in cell wall biosynthesis